MNSTWRIETGFVAMLLAIVTITLLSMLGLASDPLRRSVYELAMADAVGVGPSLFMRIGGYIVPGLLIVPVGITLIRNEQINPLGWIGAILLILSGVVWALLGIFPGQFGNEQAMVINGLLMLLFALSGGFALLLLAFGLPWKLSRVVLLTMSSLIVFASILAASPTLPVPGLLERICIFVYFVWVGVLGTKRAQSPQTAYGD